MDPPNPLVALLGAFAYTWRVFEGSVTKMHSWKGNRCLERTTPVHADRRLPTRSLLHSSFGFELKSVMTSSEASAMTCAVGQTRARLRPNGDRPTEGSRIHGLLGLLAVP